MPRLLISPCRLLLLFIAAIRLAYLRSQNRSLPRRRDAFRELTRSVAEVARIAAQLGPFACEIQPGGVETGQDVFPSPIQRRRLRRSSNRRIKRSACCRTQVDFSTGVGGISSNCSNAHQLRSDAQDLVILRQRCAGSARRWRRATRADKLENCAPSSAIMRRFQEQSLQLARQNKVPAPSKIAARRLRAVATGTMLLLTAVSRGAEEKLAPAQLDAALQQIAGAIDQLGRAVYRTSCAGRLAFPYRDGSQFVYWAFGSQRLARSRWALRQSAAVQRRRFFTRKNILSSARRR